jgi:hypothetical protein
MTIPSQEKWAYLLIFLVVFTIAWVLGPPLYSDPDTHWHIAAGKEILEQGKIPIEDPWSFQTTQPWYNIAWLFDIVIAKVYTLGGNTALYTLTLTLAGLLAAEIFRNTKTWGVTPILPRVMASLTAAGVLLAFSNLRPHLITAFLVLYSLAILQKSRTSPKILALLIPITLLWVNTHGTFPILLVILGVHTLETLIDKNPQRRKALLITTLTCLILTVLNPLGIKIYTAINRTLNSTISENLTEWKPWTVDLSHPLGVTSLLLLIITLSSLLFCNPTKKPSLSDKLLFLLFLIAGLLSVRHLSLAALAASPLLATQLSNLTIPNQLKPTLKSLSVLALWATFALTLRHQEFLYIAFEQKNYGKLLNEESINHLANLYPNRRVYNVYNTGGAIIHYGSQKRKLKHYIDGRAGTTFTESQLQEYLNSLYTGNPSLEEILKKHKITTLILNRYTQTNHINEKTLQSLNWIKIHENEKNIIYVHPKETPTETPPAIEEEK